MRGFVVLSESEIPSRLTNTVNTPLLFRFRVVGLMKSLADNGLSSLTAAVALIVTLLLSMVVIPVWIGLVDSSDVDPVDFLSGGVEGSYQREAGKRGVFQLSNVPGVSCAVVFTCIGLEGHVFMA